MIEQSSQQYRMRNIQDINQQESDDSQFIPPMAEEERESFDADIIEDDEQVREIREMIAQNKVLTRKSDTMMMNSVNSQLKLIKIGICIIACLLVLAFTMYCWSFIHQKVQNKGYLDNSREQVTNDPSECWELFKQRKCNLDELTQECQQLLMCSQAWNIDKYLSILPIILIGIILIILFPEKKHLIADLMLRRIRQ